MIVCLPTSPGAGALYLLLALLLPSVVVVVSARIWPWTSCPACHGSGKDRSPTGRNWRDCRRCSGSGKRRRALARRGDG